MKASDIIAHRLANQQICSTSFKTPGDLVHWFGAMQAQDFPMAKWAIGARVHGLSEKDIDKAIDSGKVIRTHILRPTWHFVSPDDIYWMLELTAPQIRAAASSRDKQLELTEKIYTKSNKTIEKALSTIKHLSRQDLIAALNKAKIQTDEYRSGHLLLRAELDGLICSGAAKGNQTTYALLSEKVKKKKTLTKDEALAKLAERYFLSHGPATIQDFTWWSGLYAKDAKTAIELIKRDLASATTDGQTWYFHPSGSAAPGKKTSVHLLPAFDEYIISYKNRSAAIELTLQPKAFTINGIFKPLVVINGKVIGIWKRDIIKDTVSLALHLFAPITKAQKTLIPTAVSAYSTFINKTLSDVSITS